VARIRPARGADAVALSQFLGAVWHATYDGLLGRARVAEITAQWHSPSAIESEFERPDHTRLIACDAKGTIVATASATVANETMKLHQLYVTPDAQGTGLSRRVLADLIAAAPETRTIELEVEPANARAMAFYRRLGLREVGAVADCGRPGSGIPAVLMRGDLPLALDAA